MRMIVEAFKDTLELGLEKPEQVVVRISHHLSSLPLLFNHGNICWRFGILARWGCTSQSRWNSLSNQTSSFRAFPTPSALGFLTMGYLCLGRCCPASFLGVSRIKVYCIAHLFLYISQ